KLISDRMYDDCVVRRSRHRRRLLQYNEPDYFHLSRENNGRRVAGDRDTSFASSRLGRKKAVWSAAIRTFGRLLPLLTFLNSAYQQASAAWRCCSLCASPRRW